MQSLTGVSTPKFAKRTAEHAQLIMSSCLIIPRCCLSLVACILLVSPRAATASTFTVSPTGNDLANGSSEQPFATPERAQKAAREALQRGESVEVIFRAGNYELKEPLTFTEKDSGNPKHTVIWRSAAGEEVRLSGGRKVVGWQPVSDPAVLERLDESVRSQVLQISLKDLGITDYGEMSGGFGKGGSPGMELFVNDLPTWPARYPNQGFIPITEVLGTTPVDVRGTKGAVEGIVKVNDPRIAKWAGEKDGRVLGYWFWDWAEDHEKIESVDAEQLVLKLKKPWAGFGYRKGQYFYGYNLLSEMDLPGEWYLDREADLIYFLPPASPQRIMVTLLPSVLKLERAADLSFQSLIFEGSRDHGIVATNCRAVEIKDSIVRNCGNWAIRIDGGYGVDIRSCEIYGTGAGGVALVGGDRRTLTSADHVVENCHIHDYARWSRTYQPGVRLEGVGSRVSHNLIHHAPHQAIGFAGNDHRIEFNEIHHVCQESNDAGAIYAWNDWAGRGNQITHNYLHDITGKDGKGAHGVYLDDGFSSATIFGNIFKLVSGAILLGGGRDITVTNNLFIQCLQSIQIDARGLGWRAYGFQELKDKLLQWPYQSPPWSQRYPELVRILDDEPMAPKGVTVTQNILVTGCAPIKLESKAKPFVTVDKNLIDAPDSILTPGKMPTVNSSNPIIEQIGFLPIPTEKIGIGN